MVCFSSNQKTVNKPRLGLWRSDSHHQVNMINIGSQDLRTFTEINGFSDNVVFSWQYVFDHAILLFLFKFNLISDGNRIGCLKSCNAKFTANTTFPLFAVAINYAVPASGGFYDYSFFQFPIFRLMDILYSRCSIILSVSV